MQSTTDESRTAPKGLPRTIEEASRRYMSNYEANYVGSAAEFYRLKGIAQGFIHSLRKRAPKFYEEKLPALVNQAASTLLTFDTSTPEGKQKFHRTHQIFLQILEDLRVSQPAGDVDFQTERTRIEERRKLFEKQLKLRKRLDELDSMELSVDELGEEDDDEQGENCYAAIFKEVENIRAELLRVSIEIAYIEGERVEEEIDFKLKVPPRSVLNRLSEEQLTNLESQMLKFYKQSNNNKNALLVDKSIIDTMLAKLNIDVTQWKKVEIEDLSKHALDAYKSYFREIARQQREALHEELLNNKNLMPKEGLIFTSPDDVPEHILKKFKESESDMKYKLDKIYEEFANRPCADEANGEAVEDVEESRVGVLAPQVLDSIKQRAARYARVKEEPRDDFDEEIPEESEIEVPREVAESVVNNADINYVTRDIAQEVAIKAEQELGTDDEDNTNGDQNELGARNNNEDDDDDDIECLGTIEPTDKIKTVDVD